MRNTLEGIGQPKSTGGRSGKGGSRTAIYVLAIVAMLGAAAYLTFRERAPAQDPDTAAAVEKVTEIKANTDKQSQGQDLPIEKRAPRGAVTGGR